MPIRNAIASLAVRDIDASLAWYERLLGRPADSRPIADLGEWKFERGGWLQVYQGAERAGSGSVTRAVTSLEEQISTLQDADMDPGEPIISEKVKVVMIKDPDGNSIAFAEALDPTIAQ
jgi:catechol 2,3-dioxygenase-like lactoylglutathione lyase family enzyme